MTAIPTKSGDIAPKTPAEASVEAPAPVTGAPTSPSDVTLDQFLGGKIEVYQPRARRHRSGLDAVFLAACLPERTTGRLFDLGSGVGVAGLCAAARLPGLDVTLVERDALALKLAKDNLALAANADFASRVTVIEADIITPGRTRVTQGLKPGIADHIIMNPPFYANDRHRPSPHAERAGAHVLEKDGLHPWLRTASDLLTEGGSISVIFPADGLEDLLDAMRGRFGGTLVYPLFPRPGLSATRVLVRGTRGSRAPIKLRPGLVLHEDDGHGFSATAENVLRNGVGLDIEG